jgi:phosphoglucosamine mutase
VLGAEARLQGAKPKAVIGRDPRISGEFLTAAIAAGLASSGVDVYDAGILPTPATAFLTADLDADFGVMISASHNPAQDNGIKFFARGGHKLADALEDRIEAAMDEPKLAPIGAAVGHVTRFADAEDRYLVHLLSVLPNRLDGLTVVLDCANGASSAVAPDAFSDAGAKVIVIGNDPDGMNINLGYGSTHLSALQAAVLEHGAEREDDGDEEDGEGRAGDALDGALAALARAADEAGLDDGDGEGGGGGVGGGGGAHAVPQGRRGGRVSRAGRPGGGWGAPY